VTDPLFTRRVSGYFEHSHILLLYVRSGRGEMTSPYASLHVECLALHIFHCH